MIASSFHIPWDNTRMSRVKLVTFIEHIHSYMFFFARIWTQQPTLGSLAVIITIHIMQTTSLILHLSSENWLDISHFSFKITDI